MMRELAYDPVFHSQSHFRSILYSLSRPGTISGLDPVALTSPARLNTASALVAFALPIPTCHFISHERGRCGVSDRQHQCQRRAD